MFAYKEGFLPVKRNLYEALDSEQGYHRFGQRCHFVDPFSSETQAAITVPTEEALKAVDFAALQAKYEFPAIMQIKLKFFSWFESTLRDIMERQQKPLPVEESDDESLEMAPQDPPSATETQNAVAALCIDEDVQVDNPQRKLQCIMCKLKGELTVTGRLIPFQVN